MSDVVRRSKRAGVLVALSSVALLLAAAAPGRAASNPGDWDPRVEPIATSVARIRGLRWKHPVAVTFLSEAAFEDRVTADYADLTRSERRALEGTEAELRALGLARGDVDLANALGEYRGENVLAYYDPHTERITVRGMTLDPFTTTTVAHELTHALQDQHFGLEKLDRSAKTSSQSLAVTALVEGDASRTEDRYLGDLSAEDQAAVRAVYDTWNGSPAPAEARSGATLPAVLDALYSAPYLLGPSMVDAIVDASGGAGLNRSLARAPTSDEAVYDPIVSAEQHPSVRIRAPRLRRGERQIGSRDDFGAVPFYFLLASRLGPLPAMDATDGWAGDSAITFRRDGRRCVRLAVAGHDAQDTARIGDALTQVATRLPGNSAFARARGEQWELTACDPGAASVEPSDYARPALGLLELRNWAATEALSSGLPADDARCVGRSVVADDRWAALADPATPAPTDADWVDLHGRFGQILHTCQA